MSIVAIVVVACWAVVAILFVNFGLHALWMFPLLVFLVCAALQPVLFRTDERGEQWTDR